MATAYKIVGQDNPGAVLTDLYTVPGSTSFVGTLYVGNIEAAANTFRVALSIAGATIANDHYIAYDVTVPANDQISITGISLAATDKLRVYGSDTNVTFNLVGVEVT